MLKLWHFGKEKIRNRVLQDYEIKNGMWVPLWKNLSPKAMSKEDVTALQRLKGMIDVAFDSLETVLDISGQKCIRIKKRYGYEDGIARYDYFLFGPIVIENNHLFYKQMYSRGQVLNNKKVLEDVVIMMDEYKLAEHIEECIFNKEAIREAQEKKRILGKLWDKRA